MTDNEALELARAGDDRGWDYLYSKHKSRLASIILRYVKHRGIAEDLAQDTFLKAFKCLDTFEGKSKFSTWLTRIGINMALMHIRMLAFRYESANVFPLDNPVVRTNTSGESWEAQRDFSYRDHELDSVPTRLLIEDALKELPAGYRKAVELHDLEGVSYEDMQEKLKCGYGTVRSQRSKGIERMRELITRSFGLRTAKEVAHDSVSHLQA